VRALALGWLTGTLWLQTRAELPPSWLAVLLLAAGAVVLVAVVMGPSAAEQIPPKRITSKHITSKHITPRQITSRLFNRAGWHARVLLLLLAGIALGAGWSAQVAQHRLSEALPAELEGKDLQLTGVIASLPNRFDDGQRFVFEVEHARDADRDVRIPSRVALGWYGGERVVPDLVPGQRWHLTARLKLPHGQLNPDGFDAEAWWLTEGIRANGYVRSDPPLMLAEFVFSLRDTVGRARHALRERIERALPDARFAGVIVALVIGDQRGIEAADWEVFNRTGIGHLISISGLHITMIAALFSGLVHFLWRHSFFTNAQLPLRLPARKAAAFAGLLAALVYVALAGFGIPAQRTLLMLAVAGLAVWCNAMLTASQLLACALLVVLLFDPWSVLWPGFWLSFGAIACLLFASSGRLAEGGGWRAGLRSASHTQWAVTAGLLPLTLLLFAQVSLISPIANAVAIPVVSALVTPLALAGVVLPAPLCGWVLQPAHGALSLLAAGLAWLAALPMAVWQAPKPGLIESSLAILGTLWLLAPRGWHHRWLGLLGWLPLMLAQPSAPAAGFWLTAFDIGQGNALLIETPSFRLLYDTGPAYSAAADGGSRVILPYLQARGIDRLDAVVISHSDIDHAGGARSLMQAIDIGWVASSLPAGHALRMPRHVDCVAGQRWLRDGVQFEFLHPTVSDGEASKPNARSCTLKISAGEHAALLTGDIEAPQERALLARAGEQLRADVLLAPHHGSGTSSTPEFLDAVAPSIALFQVGYRNRYRHPKASVVERYQQRGIKVLRSDRSGAVALQFGDAGISITQACETPRYWSSQRCIAE
jgi:competence protein ComEC